MSRLSGATFDRTYIAGQVKDHDKTVALINHEEGGLQKKPNQPLQQFLDVTFPKIKMHTQELHQIQAGMSGGKGGAKSGMSSSSGM
ncbi:MAG: DUF4142 domain-containing protein [Armatimonadetes bacterium]|nr:DUF4142 domain-containing protein [Armatimonadota bacterium]